LINKKPYVIACAVLALDIKNAAEKLGLEIGLKFLEGGYHLIRQNPDSIFRAKELFEEAIALDPEYATPYAMVGICLYMEVMQGSSKSPMQSFMEASKLAQKALALDETNPPVYRLLGSLYFSRMQYDEAVAALEYALGLNPKFSVKGYIMTFPIGNHILKNRWEEALLKAGLPE